MKTILKLVHSSKNQRLNNVKTDNNEDYNYNQSIGKEVYRTKETYQI